ncbi:hypothetical protein QFC19_000018 [Naganishia cerealis]|uniref:Uncharacterized protein n=1 Tax=Naganishia cerealis TaxID=610337 RepID=A0ACC2WRA5_9TREE|nr:hypothetical protein QFC19_000018 [Naganishia cerealis]
MAVTVPRRCPRPRTADSCIGNGTRGGGGLRSLTECSLKRRSVSNVLDLKRDERADSPQAEVTGVKPSVPGSQVELQEDRDGEIFLCEEICQEGLVVSNMPQPGWSNMLVDELNGPFLKQEREPNSMCVEGEGAITPSMTIDMAQSINDTGPSLQTNNYSSCPVQRPLSHPFSAPTASRMAHIVHQLKSKIAVVGLNKDTENQWEHRVQVFLIYPEEQARVVKNRPEDALSQSENDVGSGSQEIIVEETRTEGYSAVLSEHNSQRPWLSGLSGMYTSKYDRRLSSSDSINLQHQATRPFVSYIQTREGTSLATEIPFIRSLFRNVEERASLVQSGGELGMFDDEDSQERREEILESQSNEITSGAAPPSAISKLETSDSGYGSECSTTPWIDVYHVKSDGLHRISNPREAVARKSEAGVKHCLQLHCQRTGICKGGEGQRHGAGTHLLLASRVPSGEVTD